MIGYYKKYIYALSEAITSIRSAPDRIDRLKEIQALLIQRILKSEEKIDELKDALTSLKRELRSRRPPKIKAQEIKKKIKFYQNRINEHKWMLFVWRCFGDAVVFLYIDKFAIKPFLITPEAQLVSHWILNNGTV
jgi:hypothetical protein